MEALLEMTRSVCPTCLRHVPAQRVKAGERVYLRKQCPDHGLSESLVWNGRSKIEPWVGVESSRPLKADCPDGCGLCPDHLQQSCCVLLEVTARCNLACRFCFADGGRPQEPALEQVLGWVRQLTMPGKTLLQLSGGEPTVRDDLPSIVAAARSAGCPFVQLNTNGIRLATDAAYVRQLADAGLSFVFMQFDGVDDAVYQTLRGRPLFDIKRQAIAHCAAANVGVTLVPTLVPGVNDTAVGDIVRFAVAASPAVRGVHFQPVAYLGRSPGGPAGRRRLTLDELAYHVEAQTGGAVAARHLLPSRCDHPLCGFHGDFVVGHDGRLLPLSQPRDPAPACCCGPATPQQNRMFVARRWQRPEESQARDTSRRDLRDLDAFLARVKTHGFTLTAMAFQDAGTLDARRLRRCSLHVFDDGRLVPFCAHYLSAWRHE
jgi:7,8-dihydro-6-hydroxymethylpterin dimethyltransferase